MPLITDLEEIKKQAAQEFNLKYSNLKEDKPEEIFSPSQDVRALSNAEQQFGFAVEVFGVIVHPGKEYSEKEQKELATYMPRDQAEIDTFKAFMDDPSRETHDAWMANMARVLSAGNEEQINDMIRKAEFEANHESAPKPTWLGVLGDF